MTTSTGVFPKEQLGLWNVPAIFLTGALAISMSSTGASTTPNRPTAHSEFQGSIGSDYGVPAFLNQTSSVKVVEQSSGTRKKVTNSTTSIAEVRETSGLTIDQLGRLFGVSRRTVHNWLNGKNIAPRHEERLAEVLNAVREVPGNSPDEKRSELLAAREGGSLFQKLRMTGTKDATLQLNALSAKELLQL